MSPRTTDGAAAELDPEFERFVRTGSRSLFRTALLLSGGYAQAEDLFQTTLLRTARHWQAARDSPEAYARLVLVNLSHDRFRQASRRAVEDPLEHAGAFPALSDPVDAVLGRDVILGALRQLPSRQREVVVLRFYLDLSIAETARVIGTSEGTVKSYSARALTRLRELLADSPPKHPAKVSSDD